MYFFSHLAPCFCVFVACFVFFFVFFGESRRFFSSSAFQCVVDLLLILLIWQINQTWLEWGQRAKVAGTGRLCGGSSKWKRKIIKAVAEELLRSLVLIKTLYFVLIKLQVCCTKGWRGCGEGISQGQQTTLAVSAVWIVTQEVSLPAYHSSLKAPSPLQDSKH